MQNFTTYKAVHNVSDEVAELCLGAETEPLVKGYDNAITTRLII